MDKLIYHVFDDIISLVKEKSILIILGFYLLVSIFKINWLGLQYDEVLFANVARGVVDESILFKKIGSLPVMIMPYMGALKAYLYFPILKIFGASVLSVRLPMIVLTLFSVYFIYRSIKVFWGEKLALISTLLLVINPDFVSFTMYDVGPSALELFFVSACFWTLICFFKSKKKIWILMAISLMCLGLYNKLNFIWLVLSGLGSLILVSKKPFSFIKKYFYYLSFPLLLFIFVFIKFELWDGIGFKNMELRWPIIVNGIGDLINGNLFFEYLGIKESVFFNWLIPFLWLGIVIAGVWVKMTSKKIDRAFKFVFYFCLLFSLQILFTNRAANPWHIFSLEIFMTLLFVLAVNSIFRNSLIKNIVYGLMMLYFLGNVFSWFWGKKQSFENVMWSKKIDNLVKYTRGENKKFVSLDWGFHNQFLLMDPVRGKYEQIWGPLITGDFSDEDFERLVNDPNVLYVAYSNLDPRWGIMSAKDIWLKKIGGKKLEVVKEFYDKKSVYFIYRIRILD